MGIVVSKCYDYEKHHDTPPQLAARIQTLEGEVSRLGLLREREAREYGAMEWEWRRERRESRDEAAKLRRRLREEEERARRLEGEVVERRESECKDWQQWLGAECLVEHMKEEQVTREAAVEKWKHLYLTIKNELDVLILRTKHGGRLDLGVVDRLQTEATAMEATIEALQARLSSMEKERVKREREIDILRQSLRILNNGKRNGMRRSLQRRWL